MDFCRYAGSYSNPEKFACLGGPKGFTNSQFIQFDHIVHSDVGLSLPNGAKDAGFDGFPKFSCDINLDGREDYGRFVGSENKPFLSFAIQKANGTFTHYGFNASAGMDIGYHNLEVPDPWLEDVNGDGLLDYCRYVGSTNIRAAACLNNGSGFDVNKQYYWLDRRIGWRTIENEIVVSNPVATSVGSLIKYNFSKRIDESIGTVREKLGEISLNLNPEAAYFQDEKVARVFIPLISGADINIENFINESRTKGFYLKEVMVEIELEGGGRWSEYRTSPTNVNESGVYSTSESITLGAGRDPSINYSWGNTISTEIEDFNFEELNANSNAAKFRWKLSKVGSHDLAKVYENYRDLGNRPDGTQYWNLRSLPVLAREKFPVNCEAVFQMSAPSKASIPKQVTAKITIKTVFEKTKLVQRDESGAESFLRGFSAGVREETYKGELYYKFQHETRSVENVINLVLNLEGLRN